MSRSGEPSAASARGQAISQEELGDRAGLHRNYVGRIERGEVVPTLRTVAVLADALAVMPSALIARAEREAASSRGVRPAAI
jgi:transcriptional regulator with XRE-family HTH domain